MATNIWDGRYETPTPIQYGNPAYTPSTGYISPIAGISTAQGGNYGDYVNRARGARNYLGGDLSNLNLNTVYSGAGRMGALRNYLTQTYGGDVFGAGQGMAGAGLGTLDDTAMQGAINRYFSQAPQKGKTMERTSRGGNRNMAYVNYLRGSVY